jgi:hypothetical protein
VSPGLTTPARHDLWSIAVSQQVPTRPATGLDPRGVRFAATLTTVVLAVVLIIGSGWLALAQAAAFAVASLAGMRFSPYGALYRVLVAPRLAPPREREDPAPVRFSQTVGLVFTALAAAGYLSGLTALGVVATAFALVAAFLNAAFGFCLGCEMYGLLARLRARPAARNP